MILTELQILTDLQILTGTLSLIVIIISTIVGLRISFKYFDFRKKELLLVG